MQRTVTVCDRCGVIAEGSPAGWTRLSYWVMAGLVRTTVLKDLCGSCTDELCRLQTAFLAHKHPVPEPCKDSWGHLPIGVDPKEQF